MPAVPLRSDWDAGRVRAAARETDNADQVRRLLAIAAVYEGKKRHEAARVGAMDRQTLRDWVHRFDAHGPAGLIDRKAPGAACRLTVEQEAELAGLSEAGPDRGRDGVVRWRCVDLQKLILARWNVAYHVMRAPLASSCGDWASAACRRAGAISGRTPPRSRPSKKLSRAPGGERAEARPRHAHRGVVSG
jgi:transposase